MSATRDWRVAERRAEIARFNQANMWRKRGLACIPTKYGIDVSPADYHEGCELSVMADGSVLLRHGGCELGQGIHTKAAHVRKSIYSDIDIDIDIGTLLPVHTYV